MAYRERPGQANLPSLIVITGLLGWGVLQTGPVMIAGHVQPLPTALAIIGGLAGLRLLMELLLRIAVLLEWISSYRSTGKGGTAKWASRRQIKAELSMKEGGDE